MTYELYDEKRATKIIDRLTKMAKKWKPILRINDWDIFIEPRPAGYMKQGHSYMEIDARSGTKRAHIIVNMDEDFDNIVLLNGEEEIFLHELFHIVLWECGFGNVSGDDDLVEAQDEACDRLATIVKAMNDR